MLADSFFVLVGLLLGWMGIVDCPEHPGPRLPVLSAVRVVSLQAGHWTCKLDCAIVPDPFGASPAWHVAGTSPGQILPGTNPAHILAGPNPSAELGDLGTILLNPKLCFGEIPRAAT